MRISIVTTMYYSSPYLREFHARVTAAVRKLTSDYEIVFVNDGSPDDALEVATDLFRHDTHVKVVDLSRNFGHHQAMLTGLSHASGDLVFLIDCDLEEEPELLLKYNQIRQETGADVVYGVQDVRRGSFLDRVSGRLFYKVVNLLAGERWPENLMTVRLMTRRYVLGLLEHREVEINIAGLWARTGFKQLPVPTVKKRKSTTTYSLPRKLAVLFSAITCFSSKPLICIFWLGLGMVTLSVAAVASLLVLRLVFGVMLSGWLSLIVSIWLLAGLTIFCQGVIALYLAKILMETKHRPISIVREVHEWPQKEAYEPLQRAG